MRDAPPRPVPTTMLLLNTEDTKQLMTMREAAEILENAYRALAAKEAVYRPRSDMVVPLRPGQDYWLSTMEGAVRPEGVAAIRMRSDRYSLPGKKWAGRPGLFCGIVILYDMETGVPLAMINDGYLQVMRVAVTSALAGKYLARKDPRVLGIIGSGWQAKDHARAYAALFPIERIRVFSPTPAHREAFAGLIGPELGLPVDVVSSAREAVDGSDILAICTRASSPVIEGEWIAPGMFVSCIKYFREVTAQHGHVFDVHVIHPQEYAWYPYRAGTPEDWAQGCDIYDCYREDPLPPSVVPLDELVSRKHPGRTNPDQRTLMNNHAGMGIQFAVLGKAVYERAKERGLGREWPSEWFLQDIST